MQNFATVGVDYILQISKYIAQGSITSIQLYILTALFCIPIGILMAIMKISDFKILKFIVGIYTWIFRGTPLLLQLFFAYYGLPIIGIQLSPIMAAVITFSLNYGAYLTEIFRSGILAVEKGQNEAAMALGLNYSQTMKFVILPQAIRKVIPPTCNEAINLIKDSALIAAIGMGDLLRTAKEIMTRDFTISPMVIAALMYLIMSSFLVIIFQKLEQRFSIYE